MNTLGKLLVIVNLLFALATGAFLAVDFAARHKWRQVAEERTEELTVMKANLKTMQESVQKYADELKRAKADFEESQYSYNGRLGQKDLLVEQQKKEIIKHKDAMQAAILNVEKANEETKRLQQEVVFLSGVVKDREKEIAKTQALSAQLQIQNQAYQSERNSALARAQNLFQQLKEKEILLNKALAGPTTGTVAMVPSIRDPNFQNPPPTNIKGLIQHIDKVDRSLVQISLGSDAGVQKDHTLEVYRLGPQPEYLGRLRVLEAYPQLAIGRVIRPNNNPNASPLQDGDQVATKLTP